MTLLQRFRENWISKRFCAPDKTILVAVSGGLDSMALAELLLKSNCPFAVAHCNFQLRGAEADLDEELVTNWCAKHNIVLHKIKFQTKQKSEEWKKGTQETARILRYDWFEALRTAHKYAKVATAHHANDNVETLLINLCRGTGMAGIHGILPDAHNIIRPLLFAQKQELAEWVTENKFQYREDASNASDDYLRNALRHKLVPVIEELFPGAIGHINESITRFGESELLYKKAIASETKKLLDKRGQDYYIPVLKLIRCKPLTTICYELIHPFGFSAGQTEQVLNLLGSETGHYITSPTHRIIRNRDFLIVTTLPAVTADFILIESMPCEVTVGGFHFAFSIQDRPKQIDTDPEKAYIDLKQIEFPIILRKWKTGDYFYPIGMKMKKKKVSRVLINEKVPLHEKENTWVLECIKRIAWLVGMRLDERFKIKETTEQVLVVKRSVTL